jgi:hypothetical protein
MPLTLKNFNKTPVPSTTFTISRTEKSDMSSWWTYSDDAAWLTAGDGAFDDFFWYSAVLLNASWVEKAEMTQSWWVFTGAMTTLGNITSWYNVMIKFPVRWIKMSKSWSVVTLSITDGIGRESEWFQYYAFQNTWDIEANASATVATTPLYMWAYLSYTNWSKLQSWSWQTPQGNYTMWNAISYAWANWTWWTITWWYQRCLINAYYMMKYGNPDCQSVIGRWFVDGNSAAHATWWTNSYTNASWWETTGKYQCKLFWLEDWWWNLNQWLCWAFVDVSRNLYVALHDFTGNMSTSETQYKNAGTIYTTWEYLCLSSILWTNKLMFWPMATVNNTNYNTYYCCLCSTGVNPSNSHVTMTGGIWSSGSDAWLFRLRFNIIPDSVPGSWGSRLMYL